MKGYYPEPCLLIAPHKVNPDRSVYTFNRDILGGTMVNNLYSSLLFFFMRKKTDNSCVFKSGRGIHCTSVTSIIREFSLPGKLKCCQMVKRRLVTGLNMERKIT